MNNYIEAFGGFISNGVYYGHTDSLSFENKHCKKIVHKGLIGEDMLQEKKTIIKVEAFGFRCF